MNVICRTCSIWAEEKITKRSSDIEIMNSNLSYKHGALLLMVSIRQGWSCPYGDSGSRSVPKVGFFSLIQGQLCPQKFVFIAFREVGFFPPIFGRSVTGQGLSQKPACMSIC